MPEVFVSYARSTAGEAARVAEALRAAGFDVWRDDALPAHRAYGAVIEERLDAATAVVVVWSEAAAKSEWVLSEADRARNQRKLVQLRIDGARLPMPFDQIQCADLVGWRGDPAAAAWRQVLESVRQLAVSEPGRAELPTSQPTAEAPAQSRLTLPDKPSIAVMPFADQGGAADDDWFADGMVAEITNALSRFKSIFVIASSSTLTFKGRGVGIQAAARQLGVRYVLEGAVRRAANRVRVSVQLIDAASGAQIWTDRLDETLDDLFELQDRLALAVAGRIGALFEQSEVQRIARQPAHDLGAYDLYLRAYPLVETFEDEKEIAATALLDQAIALDPSFGPALALGACCHGHRARRRTPQEAHHRQVAVELAQRALGVGSDDAQVLAFTADALATMDPDVAVPLSLCERAIDINPGLNWAWFESGWIRVRAGQPELGVDHLERSMRLDPISPMQPFRLAWLGVARLEQGRLDEAVALLKQSALLLPSYPVNPPMLAAAFGLLGEVEAARSALARDQPRTPQQMEGYAAWAFREPAHRRRFLDGIAVARGETPAG